MYICSVDPHGARNTPAPLLTACSCPLLRQLVTNTPCLVYMCVLLVLLLVVLVDVRIINSTCVAQLHKIYSGVLSLLAAMGLLYSFTALQHTGREIDM